MLGLGQEKWETCNKLNMRDQIEKNVNNGEFGKPRKFESKFHMKIQDYVVFEHATSNLIAKLLKFELKMHLGGRLLSLDTKQSLRIKLYTKTSGISETTNHERII